ncbi:recombination protein RecT [Sphingomonas naasensis]|uniref:Rect protein n=1 Tax=Sphingomonas naasensis TaxID=1344951 RepID=A0A4S1WQS7_9SPHN|nr:recombinase RecT [Sphingomonas naasensis]NIJ18455.1 recombination protein RecT [Sphingomonas naasensis]TGX45718.1 rect protein [Sphingomonas naasensis]
MATQALATRENTAVTEYDRLRNGLERRANDFKMALPAHITPEKFQRTVMTAAQSNPDLLRADRGSLITSCMKAAQDGLLPDGREAAIVTFNTKKQIDGQWQTVTLAQYMPMVFGLRKKILQSGEISAIETNVVYRREVEEGFFVFEAGTEAMLRHKPMLDLTDEDLHDDNIVAAYSVASMKDGTKSFEVMRRAEINKVRQASQTGKIGGKYPPKGPWVDWFAEMARKTVMRRHSKTLPMSGDLLDVEARDEEIAARSTAALLGSTAADAPRLVPPSREEQAIAEGADPATGELPDEEDEDVARAADNEALAHREGRDDSDMGEAHNGTDPDHPFRATADDLIARAGKVELLADLNKIIGEMHPHREAAPEEMVGEVDTAIEAARTRLTAKK